MCKIWTQEVKISKSYDRNKFTFVFLKGTLMLSYVIISIKFGLFSFNFIKENEPNSVNRKCGGISERAHSNFGVRVNQNKREFLHVFRNFHKGNRMKFGLFSSNFINENEPSMFMIFSCVFQGRARFISISKRIWDILKIQNYFEPSQKYPSLW